MDLLGRGSRGLGVGGHGDSRYQIGGGAEGEVLRKMTRKGALWRGLEA